MNNKKKISGMIGWRLPRKGFPKSFIERLLVKDMDFSRMQTVLYINLGSSIPSRLTLNHNSETWIDFTFLNIIMHFDKVVIILLTGS